MRWVGAIAAALIVTSLTARAHADGAITKPPRLVTFVEATWPPGKEGTAATVVLAIEIDATGHVTEVGVVESGGADFDAAAIAAARKFVFTPGEVDRAPAPVKITYRYDFVLHEQPAPAPASVVNFEGVVEDRFSKRPIAGVTVTIVDLAIAAVTDAAGAFAFADVPAGTHRVSLAAPALVTVSTEETIAVGKKRAVVYLIEPRDDDEDGADDEEVVRASRLKKESVETTIRAEEARRVPGTQGDTLKVVQNLPGVARAAFGSGQLVVWGAAPGDTRVDVDGVEIPALYHLGGLRSTINAELVRSIELVPGAYGADHGRGLGGLVRVATRALPPGGAHGYVAIDPIDVSAMVSDGAAGDRVRFGVAGRYSLIDRVLRGVVARDVGDDFPIPRYADGQALARVALRPGEELGAMILASSDRLRRTKLSADPAERASDETDQSFWRASLRYTRLFDDGASVQVVPWVGGDDSARTATFGGGAPTKLASTMWRGGVRASYRWRVADAVTMTLGLDALGTHAHVDRAGSITLPAREGDKYVFGQPPGDDVNVDAWSADVVDVAPFAFAEVRVGRMTVTPGLRLDAYGIAASRATPRVGATPPYGAEQLGSVLEPRLSAVWGATSRVIVNAAGGLYHQAPDPEDLSAVFGTPTLGLERAWHATAGAAVKLTGTLTAEAQVYRKEEAALVTRSAAPTPMLANALVQVGTGWSTGAQLLVRQELARGFLAWVSYSISRSERRDAPDAPSRLFDYDQTHVLAAVASWEWRGFTMGVRARWASGMPRTPVVGAYYDARGDRWDPLFGAQNATRLPAFVQIDVRVERRFTWRRAVIDGYLEIENVTHQTNAEEIVYSHDWSRHGYITGLPTLAVIGVRIEL